MKKLISLFIIFATLSGVTLGKTVYVNANYPVNGDGTSWSSPYKNLQTAVGAAAAGDLVLVTNGVYSPISTGNKAITIQSVEGSSVTSIDGGSKTRCAYLGTGVVLKGFTLFNGYTTGSGGGSYGGTLIGCTISGNTAKNGGGSCYGTLTDCVIFGNTANSNGGGSYGGTLIGCTISGNTAPNGGGTRYSVVYNSTICNNTATSVCGALSRGKYYNCTIYGNTAPDYAVGYSDGHASEPSIYNCVIYGNVNTGPNTRQLDVPLRGIFYCSSIDSVDKFNLGVNTPTVFPVYGDPQFTDPANNDFTLRPTSPCIDKGANQYVTTATDLLGNPRIFNGTVDMGAYEWQSTSRFVTTPNALFPMGTKDVK